MKKTLTAAQERQLHGKHVGVFKFEFDEDGDAGEDGSVSIPDTIHVIPIGQWDHDLYGPILITAGDIREFAQNFNAGIRKGVFITAGHEGFEELPAQGWITAVETRDTGLWAVVEWNELGRETLSDKQFKFFSPEFYRDYEDPQTHQIYRNVLTGGALTKSPYFKELEAVVFSDKGLIKKFTDNQKTMDINTLLAKDVSSLSAEEVAFLKEHKAEIPADKVAAYETVLADKPAETDEEKATREAKEAADAKAATEAENVAKGLNADGSAKVEASDNKVTVSKLEFAALTKAANEGAAAFKELEAKKLDGAVTALVFNEKTNTAGKFLPKSTDKLRTFMQKLDAEQRLAFAALINTDLAAPAAFKELGGNGTVDGTAVAEVEALISTKMKADDKLSYADALKQVMSETKGLEERYDSELPSARKAQKV
jgi:hypothetical protein